MAGRGGTEGADTARNCCWLLLLPLITSDRVLMVSVSTSAGMPLARRMVVRRPSTPELAMACWHAAVTWPGLAGDTRVRTRCRMCSMLATFCASQPWSSVSNTSSPGLTRLM